MPLRIPREIGHPRGRVLNKHYAVVAKSHLGSHGKTDSRGQVLEIDPEYSLAFDAVRLAATLSKKPGLHCLQM